MLGNYNNETLGEALREVFGNNPVEYEGISLSEEDVRILDELGFPKQEMEFGRPLVIRDVYLGSNVTDHSPDRNGGLFSWDPSPERSSNPAKRMKTSKSSRSFGSNCSSPAQSDASEEEFSLDDHDGFSVGGSPVSESLIEDIRAMTHMGHIFEDLSWAEDDLFPIAPPSPIQIALPWDDADFRRKSGSKKSSYNSYSATNMWNSAKKWTQLRVEERREALSCLLSVFEDLGVREKLDISHILNLSSTGTKPVVIGLHSINDEKWRQVKNYVKKLLSSSSPKSKSNSSTNNTNPSSSSSSSSTTTNNSQARSWQPTDHLYAPLRRPPAAPPSNRVLLPSVTKSQNTHSRISNAPNQPIVSPSAVPRVSSATSNTVASHATVKSQQPCVPSNKKTNLPSDKRNIIKARRKGVNRKYKPSEHSILKKDVIQKITAQANKPTKKGLRISVHANDVERMLSGLFENEETVVLDRSTYTDVDEYIDVQS